jgi:hypothetical protein
MCFICLNNFAAFAVTDGRCGAGIPPRQWAAILTYFDRARDAAYAV